VNSETLTSIEPTKEANDDLTPAWLSVRTEGSFPPLLLIAPCFGGGCYFSDLKDLLDPDQPIYIVEPITDSDNSSYSSVEDLTTQIVDLVESNLGDSPIRLCGFSFGGNLAWDLAKQLKSRGREVEILILLDSYGESISEQANAKTPSAPTISRKSETDCTKFFSDRLSKLPFNNQKNLGKPRRSFNKVPKIEDGIRTLFKDYQYETLDLDVYVFCPLDGNAIRNTSDPCLGWSRLVTGKLCIIPASGTHHNFADKPVGRNLARSINCILKM
jgi:thioesterase domain-containing protein